MAVAALSAYCDQVLPLYYAQNVHRCRTVHLFSGTELLTATF